MANQVTTLLPINPLVAIYDFEFDSFGQGGLVVVTEPSPSAIPTASATGIISFVVLLILMEWRIVRTR